MNGLKPNKNYDSFPGNEFEQLFKSHFVSLTCFAQKYINDHDTAKEIVHKVFITIWERQHEIDFSKPIKPYLFTSVYNRCLNHIRDSRKYPGNPVEIDQLEHQFLWKDPDYLEENELEVKINNAMGKLPLKCREVFELNRFEGLKYAQVAEKLGISVKTVETQMSRALRILRDELLPYLKIMIIWILNMVKIW